MKDKTEEMNARQIIIEYRKLTPNHQGCVDDSRSISGSDRRCPTCVKADKLLSSLPPSGAASEAIDEDVIWEQHSELVETIRCDQRGDEALMGRKDFAKAFAKIKSGGIA